MYTYNITSNCSTNFTPYELVFSKQLVIPTAFNLRVKSGYTYSNYVKELKKKRMQEVRQIAKHHLITAKQKSKQQYNKKINPMTLKVKDKIMLKNMKKKNK